MAYTVQPLPPPGDLETKAVLKKLAEAHRHLAELKGMAATIPNEHILINTLALQEAKDSSAIENIVTTHDALYKTQLFADLVSDAAAKEVVRYAEALKCGFDLVRRHRILSNAHILEIQRTLEQNDAGYRRLPGTALVNDATGETVYTPLGAVAALHSRRHRPNGTANNGAHPRNPPADAGLQAPHPHRIPAPLQPRPHQQSIPASLHED